METVKLLLQQPTIEIDETSKQFAKRQRIGDLEELQQQLLFSACMNVTINNVTYLYWKQNDRISLNKDLSHKHDQTIFGTCIIAFQPLLSKLVPSFHKQVIQNQKFIESLHHEKEMAVLQSMIDFVLYGAHEVEVKNTESALIILALLNRVEGEFIDLKKKCVDYVMNSIYLENVLDLMDTIQSFLQREEKLFENEKDASILHQLKDYCLDYIGMNSEKEEFETLIKKDSNGRCTCELLDSVVKRKSVKKVKIDEIPSASSPTPLFELFQEKVGTDVELKLSSGKIVKCHKTILSSKIPYFDALFSGNWNSQEQVYGDEMEFIIEYCYGFVEQVPNPLIIPLMKKSHEFQLEELLKILQLALTISMGNFIETAQQLEEYWNELSFKVAKRKLIDFGIIIQWSLDVRERLLLSSKVTNVCKNNI